jgi:hypothetical protein
VPVAGGDGSASKGFDTKNEASEVLVEVASVETAQFFRTVRGKLMHIRAPGAAIARLCSPKAARAGDTIGEVIELGNHEVAKTLGRRFCDECLRRAGIPQDL